MMSQRLFREVLNHLAIASCSLRAQTDSFACFSKYNKQCTTILLSSQGITGEVSIPPDRLPIKPTTVFFWKGGEMQPTCLGGGGQPDLPSLKWALDTRSKNSCKKRTMPHTNKKGTQRFSQHVNKQQILNLSTESVDLLAVGDRSIQLCKGKAQQGGWIVRRIVKLMGKPQCLQWRGNKLICTLSSILPLAINSWEVVKLHIVS